MRMPIRPEQAPTLVQIESLDVYRFPVPFKVVFRHASASRSEAANVIVAARGPEGLTGYGEGCPREYVTGETVATATAFIRKHAPSIVRDVGDTEGLRAWKQSHRAAIDGNPAAFCAIEIAVLDLFGKLAGRPVEDLLGISRIGGTFRYSAVLGDSSMPTFEAQARRFREMGFRDFKVKVSGDTGRDRRKLGVLTEQGDANVRIRLDANNLWREADEAVGYLRTLDAKVFAVEEPLRKGDLAGMREVARECALKIILDESLVRIRQLEALEDADVWIVNLRISKMGGILRSLEVAAETVGRSIGLIVGAQVGETSLLTRAALTVMNEYRTGIIAAEGAFGRLLLERDLTTPGLMFGPGGELAAEAGFDPAEPGLGLRVRKERLCPL